MNFIGWMIDIAREQSPRVEGLEQMLRRSCAAGYDGVGFYLEHRFAYRSAPWAAGPGCLTPDAVRRLTGALQPAGLRIIPFLNTLGHMEGFIRSEGGQWLAEGPGTGSLQICPSRKECADFVRGLVADVLEVFDDEWVHLGGDETRQLGQCPTCAPRVQQIGPGGIYGEYFGTLCRWVLERGRRPCLWGDMLLKHPDALDAIPRETVIFDWQYFSRPRDSSQTFRRRGFDVVCCPSLQTYDSGWCFLDVSQRNIDEHVADARDLGALGVLLTTWELTCFSQYASIFPLIYGAGRRLAHGEDWAAAIAREGGAGYARAADIVGNRIPAASSFLQPGTWRLLRDCLVIRQNPFELWRRWRTEACGAAGDEILRLCDEAADCLEPDEPLQFAVELHRIAVEWVRCAERACQYYARHDPAACARELGPGEALFERLRPGLERAAASGASSPDIHRLDRINRRLQAVIQRLRALPGDATHLPAFEVLVHDAYVPDDQAAWQSGRAPI